MRAEAGGPGTIGAPGAVALGAGDAAALVAAITEAVAVRRRFQFFAWTQGHLQTLLPHGVLVCGLPRGAGSGMFFDYFHNVPLATQVLSRLCHPRDGVATAMLEAWQAEGSEPLLIEEECRKRSGLSAQLRELGLGTSLVHGIPFDQSSAGAHGFFAFVSLRAAPGPREFLLASIIVPMIFSTYCRALVRDRAPVTMVESKGDGSLSEREIQILHWVREGKSNHEIGIVLSISPLTVKNHIQRILKKLSASNRTQAVSKALMMRALAPYSPASAGGIPAELLKN